MLKTLQDWLWTVGYYIIDVVNPSDKGPDQSLFINCSGNNCDNELVADEKTKGEYIDPDQCIYRYTCGTCGQIQSYNFCLAPVPMKVNL